MSEISVTTQNIYSIGGLTIEDMELLSLALHEITCSLEIPSLDRASKLVQAVDKTIQPD